MVATISPNIAAIDAASPTCKSSSKCFVTAVTRSGLSRSDARLKNPSSNSSRLASSLCAAKVATASIVLSSNARSTVLRAIAFNRACSTSSANTAFGAIPASIGKRRRIDWQKLCTVSTRGPLSLSRISANRLRARRIISWLGVATPILAKSAVSSAVGMTVHFARRAAIRLRISAAAARV